MRFVLRAIVGLTLTLAFIAGGGIVLLRTLEDDAPAMRPTAQERVYTVAMGVLESTVARPTIDAFGVIRSWRTLQLRAAVPGRIVDLSQAFREGARVEAGDLLYRIDPADYEARLADAELALAEARADAAEAREAVRAAELELEASRTQAELREAALGRQTDLASRGFSATAAVDDARMAAAQARQEAASRAQSLVTALLGVDRAEVTAQRARLGRDEAARRLADTEKRAPFDGVLTETTAALGEVVAANQALGALIDPTALEAELRISSAEFARLLGEDGALTPATVTLTLALAEQPLTLSGALDRFGPAAAGAGGGRRVYARLALEAGTVLRAGDFVTARIAEPPIADVASVPATALTEDGRLLVVDEDDRLREIRVRVLRRDTESAVIAGAPFGARYVSARAPQLTAGLKVRGRVTPSPMAGSGAQAG